MNLLEPGTQVESLPVDLFEVVPKKYVDDNIIGHDNDAIDPSDPGPTVGLRMGVKSAFVYWSGFSENVTGHGYFQVQLDDAADFATPIDDVRTKSNWVVFNGLTSGTTYHVRVRAVDASGTAGAWSTSQDDAPSLVTSSDIATDLQADTYDGTDVATGDATAGWRIERDTGSAEFNDVVVRGTIESSTITSSSLWTYDPNDSGDGIGIHSSGGLLGRAGIEFYEAASDGTPVIYSDGSATDIELNLLSGNLGGSKGSGDGILRLSNDSGGTSKFSMLVDQIGFLGAATVGRQTIVGSTDANAALQNLLTALASFGLITDNTT